MLSMTVWLYGKADGTYDDEGEMRAEGLGAHEAVGKPTQKGTFMKFMVVYIP